ncbi:hypothetical protein CUMW_123740 [Citrus unshiu]|uniref:Uncharacterized protein n=1 Tax=Citrus sinensis TaxID=2711 RepID=A0A067E5M8_CITSI|nr:hypothetical protein CISIN_1g034668mg [Citrus sinensis]GAY50051.1 hypothetical protein CUMW_123740 [Citrus unshiu]
MLDFSDCAATDQLPLVTVQQRTSLLLLQTLALPLLQTQFSHVKLNFPNSVYSCLNHYQGVSAAITSKKKKVKLVVLQFYKVDDSGKV